jgi:hypothetical protein
MTTATPTCPLCGHPIDLLTAPATTPARPPVAAREAAATLPRCERVEQALAAREAAAHAATAAALEGWGEDGDETTDDISESR